MVEPDILLLDEPLGALDANLRKSIQTELKLLQRNIGITFVFVTHAQSEALALSDRIVVMNRGRVEQISPPEEIYTPAADRSSSPASSAATPCCRAGWRRGTAPWPGS